MNQRKEILACFTIHVLTNSHTNRLLTTNHRLPTNNMTQNLMHKLQVQLGLIPSLRDHRICHRHCHCH